MRQEAEWICFGQNSANPNQDRSPATLSVVPAARARTDPKAFLPSLSKKQTGRNWFKQQSVAVLQDCRRNFPRGLLDVSELKLLSVREGKSKIENKPTSRQIDLLATSACHTREFSHELLADCRMHLRCACSAGMTFVSFAQTNCVHLV